MRAARRPSCFPASSPNEGRLTIAASVEDAVADADFVQESLPEREDLKQSVLAAIDRATRPDVVIASSTSGLLPTRLQSAMAHPERFVVGHPFNPVYLLPLVEVCGGEKTSDAAKQAAIELYRAIGMRPLHVRKEIDGFIADRLLEALWREALWLVKDGVATTAEIDDAIRFGAGPALVVHGHVSRSTGWRAAKRACAISSRNSDPALKLPWTKLEAPELTDELIDLRIGAVGRSGGRRLHPRSRGPARRLPDRRSLGPAREPVRRRRSPRDAYERGRRAAASPAGAKPE